MIDSSKHAPASSTMRQLGCSSSPGVADDLLSVRARPHLGPPPRAQRVHQGGSVVVVQLLEEDDAHLRSSRERVGGG